MRTGEQRTSELAGGGHRLLDSCEGPGWTMTSCDMPWGSQFCSDGYWTILCNSDRQCPSGMGCTWGDGVGDLPRSKAGTYTSYGWCAKRCAGDEPSDCVRCGLTCDEKLHVRVSAPAWDVAKASNQRAVLEKQRAAEKRKDALRKRRPRK